MTDLKSLLTARDAFDEANAHSRAAPYFHVELRNMISRGRAKQYGVEFAKAEHARNARLNSLKNAVIEEADKMLDGFQDDDEYVEGVREALSALRAELRKPASEGK